MALEEKSGAELIDAIERLRTELYMEMQNRCRPDRLARVLEISRRLDEAIVCLMKQDPDRFGAP